MLTVKINDKRLEERITERAQRFGKDTQEYVNELLAQALTDVHESGPFQRLHADEHGYVLDFDEDSNDLIEKARPFAEITDTETYTRELRRKAWRRG